MKKETKKNEHENKNEKGDEKTKKRKSKNEKRSRITSFNVFFLTSKGSKVIKGHMLY